MQDRTPPVDAAPAPAPKPTISYSRAMQAVRKLFGPRGRIWKTPDGYALGIDQRPGRRVLVTGPDLWFLLFGRYEPPGTPAPELTTGADSGTQDDVLNGPINVERSDPPDTPTDAEIVAHKPAQEN